VDLMINRARSFIYATALPPVMAAMLRAALTLLTDEPWRREQLHTLTTLAAGMLRDIPGIVISGTQIIPMIVGESHIAIRLATGLQKAGFDCRAIRPPTVPVGTSRLRFSVTLNTDEYAIRDLSATLSELVSQA
jgi:8-amino-7-oxononanoate synthase